MSTTGLWLAENYGNLASVLGLGFSILAWLQAGKAKEAAEAATNAVRSQESAHEFGKLAEDAKSLLTAVLAQEKELAIRAASELAHLLVLAESRRRSFLPDDFDAEQCIVNLELLSRDLAVKGFPTEVPEKMEKLVERAQKIDRELCRIAGLVGRQSEESKR